MDPSSAGTVEAPQLVCERRVRVVRRSQRDIERVFTMRVWRLPRGTPISTPSWMSTFKVEDGHSKRSFDMVGIDEVHALAKCMAWIDDILAILCRNHDVWVGENPEYPYDPQDSKLTVFWDKARDDQPAI